MHFVSRWDFVCAIRIPMVLRRARTRNVYRYVGAINSMFRYLLSINANREKEMSPEDLVILAFGACVFGLMLVGLLLMSVYEKPLAPRSNQ